MSDWEKFEMLVFKAIIYLGILCLDISEVFINPKCDYNEKIYPLAYKSMDLNGKTSLRQIAFYDNSDMVMAGSTSINDPEYGLYSQNENSATSLIIRVNQTTGVVKWAKAFDIKLGKAYYNYFHLEITENQIGWMYLEELSNCYVVRFDEYGNIIQIIAFGTRTLNNYF